MTCVETSGQLQAVEVIVELFGRLGMPGVTVSAREASICPCLLDFEISFDGLRLGRSSSIEVRRRPGTAR
jgi:hypothetical protein